MPITIGSNIASLNAQRQLGKASDALGSTYERLSSGLRINRASDDAAGLSIATTLNTDTRVFTQGMRNINDGMSYLNISEGALTALSGIVTRQMELAEQAANGTYSLQQRTALNTEANSLVDEFNRVTQSTSFNGVKVFDTSNGDLRIQAGYGVSGSVDILTNDQLKRFVGNTTFQSGVTYSSQNASGIQVYDINGDGINDILSAGGYNGTDGALHVLVGNSDGTFKNQTFNFVLGGGGAQAFTLGDFNNDGMIDAAVSTVNDATFGILLGNGDGTFKLAVTYHQGGSGGSHLIDSGDINGDGILDLVTSDQFSGNLYISIGNGNGTFRAGNVVNAGLGNTYGGKFKDLNGDGKLDLAASDGAGDINVFIGRGDGTFNTFKSYGGNTGANAGGMDFGDFNNDGIADVALSTFARNGVTVMLGNSDGSFKVAVTYAGGSNTNSVKVGDMNGDGILDLVSTPSGGSNVEIRLGNGDGTFKYSASFAQAGNSNGSLALGDTNRDGVLDIVQDRIGIDSLAVFQQNTNTTTTIGKLYLLTQAGARESLETSRATLQRISSELGNIGANQSRLSTALKTLGTARENYSAAASRITDVDVAEESSKLVSTQILQQASASVLAQANLQPQLALKLLING